MERMPERVKTQTMVLWIFVLTVMIFPASGCDGEKRMAAAFLNQKMDGDTIAGKDGKKVWTIQNSSKEGTVSVDRYGRLLVTGLKNGECSVSLADPRLIDPDDHTFEAGILLDRPEVLSYPHSAVAPQIISFTIGGRYRIVYQASLVWNPLTTTAQTGWFLYDITSEDFTAKAIKSPPLAMVRCRLSYGELYTVYFSIRSAEGQDHVRFFIDDPAMPEGGTQLLIDWKGSRDGNLPETAAVQMGCTALENPSPRLYFQRIRMYPAGKLEEMQTANRQRRETMDNHAENGAPVTVEAFLKQAVYSLGLDIKKGIFGQESAFAAAKSYGIVRPGDKMDAKKTLTWADAAKISVNAVGDRWTRIQAEEEMSGSGGALTEKDCTALLKRWNIDDLNTKETYAETSVPQFFSNNMVMQRGRPLPVWGRGIEGDEIIVSMGNQTRKTKVENGNWRVVLPSMEAGGPYDLTVKGRDKAVSIRNVMIGEVWVLAGQSNMGWSLFNSTGGQEEAKSANEPDIRIVVTNQNGISDEPAFDVPKAVWKQISPDLNGAYSAIGYYFAKGLHDRLNVPIGLVNTAFASTQIQSWIPEPEASAGIAREQAEDGEYRGMDGALMYNGLVAPLRDFPSAG
ncbi:MAG TPA: hypothetical protein DD727_04515 [Clostridiales bacterium]|nr:hypothetical protein [Clostridiales bacterium]